MNKFKISMLVATSLVTLILSENPSYSMQRGGRTPVSIPGATRPESNRAFHELEARAASGDQEAKQIIRKWPRDYRDAPEAVQEYNDLITGGGKRGQGQKVSQGGRDKGKGEATMGSPRAHDALAHLEAHLHELQGFHRRKVNQEGRALSAEQLQGLEAEIEHVEGEIQRARGAQGATGKLSLAGGHGGMGAAEKEAFEGKIQDLEARLANAKTGGEGGKPLSADEKDAIINELRREIALLKAGGAAAPASSAAVEKALGDIKAVLETPKIDPKRLKDGLEEFLFERPGDEDISKLIDLYSVELANSENGSVRQEQLIKLFGDLQEQGRLKEYFVKMNNRRIAHNETTIIIPRGEAALAKLGKVPDEAFLQEHPILVLVYTAKDKLRDPTWSKNNAPTFAGYLKYATLDDLAALYVDITRKRRLQKYDPTQVTGLLNEVLHTAYDKVVDGKEVKVAIPGRVKAEAAGFIATRLKDDKEIDYHELEEEILRTYHAQQNRFDHYLKPPAKEKDPKGFDEQKAQTSPFLLLLTFDYDNYKKLELTGGDFGKVNSYYVNIPLDELEAIVYHLASIHIATKGDLPDQIFFKNLVDRLRALQANPHLYTPLLPANRHIIIKMFTPRKEEVEHVKVAPAGGRKFGKVFKAHPKEVEEGDGAHPPRDGAPPPPPPPPPGGDGAPGAAANDAPIRPPAALFGDIQKGKQLRKVVPPK
ncbi:MAG: hypothetical protein K2Y18_01355 [Alphaproteobacteria bacterium]|nr:hypothetical protein [Alphaproteobacteria bacterium]